MKILKRSGHLIDFDPSKILNRIKKLSIGLTIDCDNLAIVVQQSLYDGMSSHLIDEQLSILCANKITIHPDYSILASRVLRSSHSKYIKVLHGSELDHNLHFKILNSRFSADYKKKFLMYGDDLWKTTFKTPIPETSYFSWMTVYYGYFLLDEKETKMEDMRLLFYRVALGTTNTFEDAVDTYKKLALGLISNPSPFLFNAGLMNGQYSSCVLISNYGDSKRLIFDTKYDVCDYSSESAGIGLWLGNVRSKNTKITKTGRGASGPLKLSKIYNELSRFYHQGSRNGSFAIYQDIWHMDIIDHLKMTLKTGNNELRARDLFAGITIPDEFMRRVNTGSGDWYLFCPKDIAVITKKNPDLFSGQLSKPLYDLFGEDWNQKYDILCQLADKGSLNHEKTSVVAIWNAIIISQQETGLPYTLYRDAANNKSNQKNIGTIRCSNLCIEILEVTDKDTIATCNLSSIPVNRFLKRKVLFSEVLSISELDELMNWELMGECVQRLIKNINYVMGINHYINKKAVKGVEDQRAIGIGIQGLADLFTSMKIKFTSDEAKFINKKIAETIYYYAILESVNQAKLHGTYKYYEGSPISQGIFQFNMWNIDESTLHYPWATLREAVLKYGVRNSLTTAYMPTASSSNILGNSEMYEPLTYLLFSRKVISGEYLLINEHLVGDLIDLGLWNESMRLALLNNNGSIQSIDPFKIFDVIELELSEKADLHDTFVKLKEIYKNVWETSQKSLIEMAADRGPFIDQTQSMNLYIADGSSTKIHSALLYAWKLGLKTGNYYLRTEPALSADKSLASASGTVKQVLKSKFEKSDDCTSCSG